MKRHPPKLYALEAKLEGLLSERSEQYLDRHLRQCDTCQAALRAMQEYRSLRDAARKVDLPELSFERFEQKLAQERKAAPAVATGSKGKLIAIALPVLAIAATVLIGFIGISGQREVAQRATVPQVSAPEQPPVVEDARLKGWVTAGASGAFSQAIEEGATLRTGSGEELQVHLADNTGIVLGADTELTLTRLRAHEIRLSLVRGSVWNTVRKLAPEDAYSVEAGDVTASVRGTRFFVSRASSQVSVDVHEGKVAVFDHGREAALLLPGQSYATAGNAVTRSTDRKILGLDAISETFPTLRLPVLPQVAAWHMAETRFSGSAELAMRAPAGVLQLSFEDARGTLHPFEVTLAPEGTRVEEGLIRSTLQAEADARMGTLDPEQISPVLQQGMPSLKRCYEQSLRRAPELTGRFTLAVRVAADGHVARAELRGDAGLPADLTRCIASQAKLWQFPQPAGGPVAFEVPVNLKSSSAP